MMNLNRIVKTSNSRECESHVGVSVRFNGMKLNFVKFNNTPQPD